MGDFSIDVDRLRAFEQGLNPYSPESGKIPARVLGYGEISTVLEIVSGTPGHKPPALVYKRMPMFRTEEEVQQYSALYYDYVSTLTQIGVQHVPAQLCNVSDPTKGRFVLYIVQEKLPAGSIGNQVVQHLPSCEVCRLVLAVLHEVKKVIDFNREQEGRLELGIDAQISNWSFRDFDPARSQLVGPINPVNLDTGTPLLRRYGREQLNPEWFLRSAPFFLVWLLKLLFLKDLMTRYYDFRLVATDIVANFYKEQRPELIPALVDTVNAFFSQELPTLTTKPFTVKEVRAYYRQDAWIWRAYLAARRLDRSLHRLAGVEYPYILPGTFKR